jgi:hypothetical protein
MIIEVSVSTDKVGSRCTREIQIDDEEFEGMTDFDRDEEIEEIARAYMLGMVNWDWEFVK